MYLFVSVYLPKSIDLENSLASNNVNVEWIYASLNVINKIVLKDYQSHINQHSLMEIILIIYVSLQKYGTSILDEQCVWKAK